jgi:NADH-quinone oxidoreductase subunit N
MRCVEMVGLNDALAMFVVGIPIVASSLILLIVFLFNVKKRTVAVISLTFGIAELIGIAYVAYLALTAQYSSALNNLLIYDGFSTVPILIASFVLQLYLASLYVSEENLQMVSILSAAGFLAILASFLLATTSSIALFISSWLMLSISSYAAVGAFKTKETSDAALKYAIMGTLSTLFIVMWLGTGAYLPGDNIYSSNWYGSGKLFLLASAFLLAGVGFKLGVFPFHWWMPDVYTFAEGRAIALITGVAKVGAILGFARMIYYMFYVGPSEQLIDFIAVMSILTMTFGNIAALTTRLLPRILAYSSIAQVGYIMVGIVGMLYGASIGNQELVYLASSGISIQTIGYSLAKSASYLFSGEMGTAAMDEKLRGIFKTDSISAASLAIFLLSLLGLPPLVGFWGKLYLFESAVSYSFLLVMIAIINSGISSYYYGRLISVLFSEKGEKEGVLKFRITYIIVATLLFILGIGVLQVLLPHLSIRTL